MVADESLESIRINSIREDFRGFAGEEGKSNVENTVLSKTKETESKITRRGAMAVVLSEDRQKVLLLRREIFILWDLPGGGIDKDEEPDHAAVRECREETGYIIELDRAIGKYLHQSVYGAGDQLTYTFRGHVVGGKPKRIGLEITQLRWCDVMNLPRGLEALHRQIIADAIADSREMIERRIDFPLVKLYPARVVFFVMRVVNNTIRRFL